MNLIAATHGRSLWIVDTRRLEQLTTRTIAKAVARSIEAAILMYEGPTLVPPETATAMFFKPHKTSYGVDLHCVTGAGDASCASTSVAMCVRGHGNVDEPRHCGIRRIVELHHCWHASSTQPAKSATAFCVSASAPLVLDLLQGHKYDSTALATAKVLLTLPCVQHGGISSGWSAAVVDAGVAVPANGHSRCGDTRRPAEAVATAAGGRGGPRAAVAAVRRSSVRRRW
jgi:hypothetical protein